MQIEDRLLKVRKIPVSSLNELIIDALNLDSGNYLIAWEPLASGLKRVVAATENCTVENCSLVPAAEHPFQHWISICYHRRWEEHSNLAKLRDQMRQLFIHEWRVCRLHPEWAERCLFEDPHFLKHFEGASGLTIA